MMLDHDQRRAFLVRLIGCADERAGDAQGCPCSTSKVAAFPRNEVAVDRASDRNALEAHRKEDSHEPCCHRSGWQGIPDLHPSTRRGDHRRAEGPDAQAHRVGRDVGAGAGS